MLLINNNCLLCSPPHQAAAAVGAGNHRLLWDPKAPPSRDIWWYGESLPVVTNYPVCRTKPGQKASARKRHNDASSFHPVLGQRLEKLRSRLLETHPSVRPSVHGPRRTFSFLGFREEHACAVKADG